MKIEQVIKKVYNPEQLQKAWQQVKKNAGAAGVDQMEVEDFLKRGAELGPMISRKLQEGSYRFKPARRVWIEKDGGSGKRPLGIPTVMDRIVGMSMHLTLEELFDPEFSESSFGFRRGKSQHMAIDHVQSSVSKGYQYCVSIDLKGFFDNIPHDLILKLIRRKIADERFVTLIARALKAGFIEDGEFHKTNKGCPQGSPLSPILSNIVLNELDKELENRGLRFCRWADDFVIMAKSPRASQRILSSVSKYLEEKLGLEVNKSKSRAGEIKEIAFLGFKFYRGKIGISQKSIAKFKNKVRLLTKRNNPLSMYQIILKLNVYLRGWVNYFKIQEFKMIFNVLDGWIRSRLRSMQLKKWKNPRKFQSMMIKAGFDIQRAKRTWIKMDRWQSTVRKEVKFTLNIQWFRDWELIFLKDFVNCNSSLVV